MSQMVQSWLNYYNSKNNDGQPIVDTDDNGQAGAWVNGKFKIALKAIDTSIGYMPGTQADKTQVSSTASMYYYTKKVVDTKLDVMKNVEVATRMDCPNYSGPKFIGSPRLCTDCINFKFRKCPYGNDDRVRKPFQSCYIYGVLTYCHSCIFCDPKKGNCTYIPPMFKDETAVVRGGKENRTLAILESLRSRPKVGDVRCGFRSYQSWDGERWRDIGE